LAPVGAASGDVLVNVNPWKKNNRRCYPLIVMANREQLLSSLSPDEVNFLSFLHNILCCSYTQTPDVSSVVGVCFISLKAKILVTYYKHKSLSGIPTHTQTPGSLKYGNSK
jgi:hypothetical protein